MKDKITVFPMPTDKKIKCIDEMVLAITNGDYKKVSELSKVILSLGFHPHLLVKHILEEAMSIVGNKFIRNQIFLPEVILSVRAAKSALMVLKKDIKLSQDLGKILLMTVENDMHDLGKTVFATLLEGSGFNVLDIGVNVSASNLKPYLNVFKPDIIGISTSLTTTENNLKRSISVIKQHNKKYKSNCKIIVGGIAVSQEMADKVGANNYARDAMQGIEKCKSIMGICEY